VQVPAVVSVIVIGEEDPVAVTPDEDVTVYPVIVEPPVAPAVKVTDTTPLVPPEAVPIVGACGTVAAVTALDVEDAEELPLALAAVMV
jgi:hypothetical protein